MSDRGRVDGRQEKTEVADREVRDFELDVDWRFIEVVVLRRDRRQAEVGAHDVLGLAGELFDAPNDAVFVRHILHFADAGFERRRVSVRRHRNDDFHVIGGTAALEVTLGFDGVLHARVRVRFDHGLNPDQRAHLRVETVHHQIELAVRRDERNRAVVLKTAQHTEHNIRCQSRVCAGASM